MNSKRTNPNRLATAIAFALVAALGQFAITNAAAAASRDQVLEVLDQVVAPSPDDRLRVWANEGDNLPLEEGTPIKFHFEARKDLHLTAFYLDADGNLVLLYPAPEGTRLGSNQRLDLEAGEATTPYGLESLFVVGSERPITREALGIDSAEPYAVLEGAQAIDAARRLRDLAAQGGAPGARVDLHIVPTQRTGQGLTRGGIVQYFTEATRSLHRPKLALEIHFETDSADLLDDAREDLDVVGQALVDERMVDKQFRLVGHTDQRGDENYNMGLSQARARSAREYLIEKYGIEPERLDFLGLGESKPMMQGEDPRALERNRRVELELVR